MLKNNMYYFNLMKQYPEQIIDKYYSNMNDMRVIPENKEDSNILTKATDKLYRFIDTFETLSNELNGAHQDKIVGELLKKIDDILIHTDGINYSSLCQYFMVQNISHSIYSNLDQQSRLAILTELLKSYIKNRHHMYKSHGYTNAILQTMSDNYSHKRKGKAGIIKIENQLNSLKVFKRIKDLSNEEQENFYFLEPDKGDKKRFDNLLKKHSVSFPFRKFKQGKLPDVLIKIKTEYYIVEHKSMKEAGGGQDKQIAEILDFIRYTETNEHFHYITYLDGIFANKLLEHSSGKNNTQYTEIQEVLKRNPCNYFVNTHAFLALLTDLIN